MTGMLLFTSFFSLTNFAGSSFASTTFVYIGYTDLDSKNIIPSFLSFSSPSGRSVPFVISGAYANKVVVFSFLLGV